MAATHPVRDRTEVLLQELTRQVVHLSSPRFAAGDFNQELQSLREIELWKRAGFTDLQDLAWLHWQMAPAMTCKGKTGKDFVFVSPELRDLLLAVRIDNVTFPDHAVLSGNFRRLGPPEPAKIWRQPKPFDLSSEVQKSLCRSTMHLPVIASDPTEAYKELCHQYEQALRHTCRSLGHKEPHSHQLGRGKTTHLSTVVCDRCPVKPSRLGERAPAVHVESLMYRRCFTQLRRLVNFARMRDDSSASISSASRGPVERGFVAVSLALET